MTFAELQNLIKKYNIPEDVHLMSNSGWECSATEMDGPWYHKEDNEIHFTQVHWRDLTDEDYSYEDVGSKKGQHRTGWIKLV